MIVSVYIAIYAGILIFLAGCLRRILQYSRTPLHLRWELYPVPHEDPSRVSYGGSYFESGHWWLSPQVMHHRREWTTMLREIVFMKGLWEFNPRLWLPSFLFHFGLYLSIAAMGLATAAALSGMLIAGAEAGRFSIAMVVACNWMGGTGIFFVLIGASLLLLRRITDPALRNYTKAGDIFNLAFFMVTCALLVAGVFGSSTKSPSLVEIARDAFSFNRGLHMGAALGVGLILSSVLIAYIPFTHMAHFIAKYFTWHSVRWDDRRNERGSVIEKEIAACLNYRPTWDALHVGADGKKSWAEIAASNPVQEVRK